MTRATERSKSRLLFQFCQEFFSFLEFLAEVITYRMTLAGFTPYPSIGRHSVLSVLIGERDIDTKWDEVAAFFFCLMLLMFVMLLLLVLESMAH